jgi:hypothetical protein
MATNLAALAVLVRVGGVAKLSPFAQVPLPLLGMSILLAFTGRAWHFSPYVAVKTPIDDSRCGPCNQSATRE